MWKKSSLISCLLTFVLLIGSLPTSAIANLSAIDGGKRLSIQTTFNTSQLIQFQIMRNGVRSTAFFDKQKTVLRLHTTEIVAGKRTAKQYEGKILQLTNQDYIADFVELSSTGKHEVTRIDSRVGQVAVVPLLAVPAGIAIGEAVLAYMLASSMAVVIAGVTYTVADSIIARSSKEQPFRYYSAIIRNQNVYVGKGLTDAEARNEFKLGRDVWAISELHARQLAGGFGGLRGPEKHSRAKGYYCHFHSAFANAGIGHAFYPSTTCVVK